MQHDPSEEMQNKQVKENSAQRKRAMVKERSRRFREKKRLNVLKSLHHVVHSFHFCRVVLSTGRFFFPFFFVQRLATVILMLTFAFIKFLHIYFSKLRSCQSLL